MSPERTTPDRAVREGCYTWLIVVKRGLKDRHLKSLSVALTALCKSRIYINNSPYGLPF